MPAFGSLIRQVAWRLPLKVRQLFQSLSIALTMVAVLLPGCRLAWWHGNADLVPEAVTDVEVKEYREWATQVDFPDVASEPPPSQPLPVEPRRLRNFTKDDLWDITLQEAVHIALSHSDIIRSSGLFLSPGNPILANPDFAPSAHDVAIQESGVLFGQRGVEAALSEFDAQFTTTMTWGRDERIQNNRFTIGLGPGSTLVQETANFNATLQKRLSTGGVFGITHLWNYEGNNVMTGQLFPSVYTGQIRTEFRQPLWAGAGTEYTRIAGPITQDIQGVTGVQQGVVIARINNDITIADFEQSITSLSRDVEELYWQLYLAYQQFDAQTALHHEAMRAWQGVQARIQAQTTGGGALEAAEARDQLLRIEGRLNVARNGLYDIEARLRRMMALPPNDGRILRPVDEPILAEIRPDWQLMLGDALAHRVELRKQKWNVKRLELELTAARHLTKPRLDFVSRYRVNAFGDDLLGKQSDGLTTQGLGSAYRTLTGGQQTGWDLGFEFSVPVGLRFAHAQVRNAETKLAKARAALSEQEAEIGHELAAAFRQLDSTYLSMQSNLNQKLNAEKRLRTVELLREATPDRVTQDSVLRAHDQFVQTKLAFVQAIVDYNIAVMDLHYRSGTLLGLNNVHLAEGPWTPEARVDAVEKAARRALTIPTATMLRAEPAPFAQPVGEAVLEAPPAEVGPAFSRWSREDFPDAPSVEELPALPPLLPQPADSAAPSAEPQPPATGKQPHPYHGPRLNGPQFPSTATRNGVAGSSSFANESL